MSRYLRNKSAFVGSLVAFPPNQPILITNGLEKFLKTGVVALQTAYPLVPFTSIGAFGAAALAAKGFSSTALICYAAGLFVTVSTNFNVPAYFQWSVDGKTWTAGTKLMQYDGSANGDSLALIIWDGAQFVAMGSNTVWTSADGKAWTMKTKEIQTICPGFNLVSLMKGNGLYVAVDQSGKIITSPDLINWTNRGQPLGTLTYSVGCAFNGTKFVFTIGSSVSGAGYLTIYTSANGYGSFSAGITTATIAGTPVTLLVAPSNVIVVGTTFYFQAGGYLLSSIDNGATWTGVTSNSGMNNLHYANNVFFCGTTALQVAADGANWRAMGGINPYSYTPSLSASASGGGAPLSHFPAAWGANTLVCNANDATKTIVFNTFDQYIDNFVATNVGGNPYYMKVQ